MSASSAYLRMSRALEFGMRTPIAARLAYWNIVLRPSWRWLVALPFGIFSVLTAIKETSFCPLHGRGNFGHRSC